MEFLTNELRELKEDVKELNAALAVERKESRRIRVLNSKLVEQVQKLRGQLEDADERLRYAEEKLKESAEYVEVMESPLHLPYDACTTVEAAERTASW